MKNMFKKVSALTLVGAMALSTNAFATTVDGLGAPKTLAGDSTVKNPVFEVVVPANFNFTIDPMKILGKDTQIFSDPFLFVNKSNVPIELNVKVTPTLTGTVKPTPKTEDDVLASSADVAKVDKSFSLYVAPIIASKLDDDGITLDETNDDPTPTDNIFAKPTSYIGVGTTTASFNTVLNVSDEYDDTNGWVVPTANQDETFDAFKIVGSVNKNAPWAASDLKVAVTYQFAGMATDDYANTFLPLDSYQNITKYTNGTGAFVATPRFRDKVKTIKNAGAVNFTVELGSTAAAYYKGLATASQTATALTVGTFTVMKNGVADTTSIKAADLSFAVNIDSANPEKGLIGTLTLSSAAAGLLATDATYTINALQLKGTGTTPPTFVTGTNGGATIIK